MNCIEPSGEGAAVLQADMRSLQQDTEVRAVTTPEELQAAIKGGAVHIEIQDHLDLTGLEASSEDSLLLFSAPKVLQSIRVCSCFCCHRAKTKHISFMNHDANMLHDRVDIVPGSRSDALQSWRNSSA